MTYILSPTEQEYIASLPFRRKQNAKGWMATQSFPCPLLAQCNKCKEYMPITSFYSIKTNKSGRIDVTGGLRMYHCGSCSMGNYFATSQEKKLYYAAKQRAKLIGVDFNIELSDIVIPQYCPVLGIELKPVIGKGPQGYTAKGNSPTIDRFDNNQGYVKGNITIISYRANALKGNATLEEMQAITNYMANGCPPSAENSNTNAAAEVML
jgi:hypothetical protein